MGAETPRERLKPEAGERLAQQTPGAPHSRGMMAATPTQPHAHAATDMPVYLECTWTHCPAPKLAGGQWVDTPGKALGGEPGLGAPSGGAETWGGPAPGLPH